VASLVAAAHWPVLAAQAMAMDDDAFFGSNPLVTRPGWASTARFFSEVLQPSTVRGYYLPLSMTSLMVDHALGGRPGDLGAFHRTNLALHVLSTALLVLLLHRLFGALAPAVVAGLLFGLHPLTVEPVAWVGERKTLLAACFALGSLLAYVQSTRRGGRGWTAGSVACFALALLSKPTVTPLPLLLLLLDAWPLRRLSARAVVEKWPFFALGLASVAITLVSHSRSAVILAAMPSELAHWPLHAGYLLAFYLGKLVAPADLTCVYPQPQPLALSNPAVALGVTVVVALAAGLLLLARRAPGPLVGAAFFVLAIAPTLGLVKYSWVVASDKYVYFPAVGLMLPIAAGLTILGARRGAGMRVWLLALPLAPLLLAEAHGVRATLRNWRDTPTLYRHMARLAPDAPEVMNGLARIAIAESRPDEALRYLSKSVAIEPGVAETRYNLGILLAARGETARALEHLRRAEALRPDDPEILGALGAALRAAGNGREAIPFLRRAVQVDPGFQQGLIALGQALVQEGQPEEGAPWLRRAFEGASDDAGLGYELAAALLLVPGATPEALTHLRRVVGLRPDWAPALNTLAWVLATTPDPALRDPGEARRLSARAVELTGGGRPEVLDTFAAALASAGEFAEAARVAERAARLAERGGAGALAREIRARLDLYRAGAAYVAPAEGSGGGPAS
jgi:tetratricopeptide (TPR) repeat protein